MPDCFHKFVHNKHVSIEDLNNRLEPTIITVKSSSGSTFLQASIPKLIMNRITLVLVAAEEEFLAFFRKTSVGSSKVRRYSLLNHTSDIYIIYHLNRPAYHAVSGAWPIRARTHSLRGQATPTTSFTCKDGYETLNREQKVAI